MPAGMISVMASRSPPATTASADRSPAAQRAPACHGFPKSPTSLDALTVVERPGARNRYDEAAALYRDVLSLSSVWSHRGNAAAVGQPGSSRTPYGTHRRTAMVADSDLPCGINTQSTARPALRSWRATAS